MYPPAGALAYTDNGTVKKDFLSLGGHTVVELQKSGTTTTPVYLHDDLLGSPRKATSATKAVLWQEHFDPYGYKLNGVVEKVGYTGQAYDSDTSLEYMKARFYYPQDQRFFSPDPISFQEGNASSFNRYAYANNNPYRYKDPDGKSCTSANGNTTCSVPVTGSHIPQKISFPTPKGFPAKIDSSQSNYHSYDKTVSAGSNSAGKADGIRQGITNDPTPGNDQPATAQGAANDASPQGGLMGLAGKLAPSPVMSYTRTDDAGNSVEVNVTMPGHPLFPGYVARSVQIVNGQAIVHNVGEGTGLLQSPASPLADTINNVWIDQSQQIIDRVQ